MKGLQSRQTWIYIKLNTVAEKGCMHLVLVEKGTYLLIQFVHDHDVAYITVIILLSIFEDYLFTSLFILFVGNTGIMWWLSNKK